MALTILMCDKALMKAVIPGMVVIITTIITIIESSSYWTKFKRLNA